MVPRYFSFSINFSTVYISCTLKEQKDAAIYILYICKKKRQQKCFFFYLTLDSHVYDLFIIVHAAFSEMTISIRA